MKTNSSGIQIIKHFEGCKLYSYQDSNGMWTIGYGSTQGVIPDMKISQEQADTLLVVDLEEAEDSVFALLCKDVSENAFSALVSFSYNLGFQRLAESTLLAHIHGGDMSAAADEFLRWNKCAGKTLKGLVKRRKAERFLFLADGDVSSDQKFLSLLN